MQHPFFLSTALKTDRLRDTHCDERAGYAVPGAWKSPFFNLLIVRFYSSTFSHKKLDCMEVAEALREATAARVRACGVGNKLLEAMKAPRLL